MIINQTIFVYVVYATHNGKWNNGKYVKNQKLKYSRNHNSKNFTVMKRKFH